jgi:hypothetical protein
MRATMPKSDGYAYRVLRTVERFGANGCTVSQFSAGFFPAKGRRKSGNPAYRNSVGSQVLMWLAERGLLLALAYEGAARDRVFVLSAAGRAFMTAMVEAATQRAHALAGEPETPHLSAPAPSGEADPSQVGAWDR